MNKRIVNYGCSHAFGAEIAGRGNVYHADNVNLNFGNLVAKHFNRDFKIAARPGNSNRQILHDVIEFVQPGDICLLSWTYADRERWIVPGNNNPDENTNYTLYHTLSVLQYNDYKDSSAAFLSRFFPSKEKEEKKKIESSHYFLKNADDPIVKSVCQTHYDYHSNTGIQTLNFLEIYKCANEIIKSRGATAVNFHYDMEPETLICLKYFDEMNTKYFQASSSYYNYHNELDPEFHNYFLTHSEDTENCELYRFYHNDSTRINWVKEPGVNPLPYSFTQWYMEKYHNKKSGWPGDLLGHLDAEAHNVLSEFIIKKLEEILNAN